jgi:hypothetical protein
MLLTEILKKIVLKLLETYHIFCMLNINCSIFIKIIIDWFWVRVIVIATFISFWRYRSYVLHILYLWQWEEINIISCQDIAEILLKLALNTNQSTLCDQVCQWLATGRWFSLETLVSSINKNDCYDITEIILKVALKHHKSKPEKIKQNVISLIDWLVFNANFRNLISTWFWFYYNFFFLFCLIIEVLHLIWNIIQNGFIKWIIKLMHLSSFGS